MTLSIRRLLHPQYTMKEEYFPIFAARFTTIPARMAE